MAWRDALGALGGAFGGPLGGFAAGELGGYIDRSRSSNKISGYVNPAYGGKAGGASRGFDWQGASEAIAGHVAARRSRPPPIPGGIDPAQAGVNTKSYNDAAYPGTTPWEQLGGGSNANAMETEQRGNELRQRERESQRNAQVQARTNAASIQASRQSAAASVSRDLLGNFGASGLSRVDKILNATGVITDTGTGYGENPLASTSGRVRSEINRNRASAAQSRASAGLSGKQAGVVDKDAETRRIASGGKYTREIRSGWDMTKSVGRATKSRASGSDERWEKRKKAIRGWFK